MKAIRVSGVVDKTSLSRTTILKWVAAGKFPKPFKLGTDVLVWDEADVDKWLQTKKQEVYDEVT